MFKYLYKSHPVLRMTHTLFPPIFLTTLWDSRDLYVLTRLISFPNCAHLTTSSVFRYRFVVELWPIESGQSVIYQFQAQPLNTSPVDFSSLTEKKTWGGRSQNKRNGGPWVSSWKAVPQRCWYKEEINFCCDNYGHVQVYVIPINMSLINIHPMYPRFADEVTSSEIKNLPDIAQKSVRELEFTRSSALTHSILPSTYLFSQVLLYSVIAPLKNFL